MNSAAIETTTVQAGNNSTSSISCKKNDSALKKACSDFESLFIYQLLQTMRKTIPQGGYLSGKGLSNDTYTMMFDQKVAESLSAKGRGIGLQEVLYAQLSGANKTFGKD